VSELKRQIECEYEFIENVNEISYEEDLTKIKWFENIRARLSLSKSLHQERANRLLNIILQKKDQHECTITNAADEILCKKPRHDPETYRSKVERRITFPSLPPLSPPTPLSPPGLAKHCVVSTPQVENQNGSIAKGKKKRKRGACKVLL
jgi:hypothetical protein